MYFSDRVKLIRRVTQLDEAGNPVLDDIGNPAYTDESLEVWADLQSPSRAETAAAGAMGLKPSCTVVVHASDYTGQTIVEVAADKRLTVYRTFKRGEDVELYVTEKAGNVRGK